MLDISEAAVEYRLGRFWFVRSFATGIEPAWVVYTLSLWATQGRGAEGQVCAIAGAWDGLEFL